MGENWKETFLLQAESSGGKKNVQARWNLLKSIVISMSAIANAMWKKNFIFLIRFEF